MVRRADTAHRVRRRASRTRKLAALGCAAALCMAAWPCSWALSARAQVAAAPSEVQAAQAGSEIGPAEIREIQESLTALGFDAGPADGLLGEQTRSAIVKAQRQLGWETDGEPSPELLEVLRRTMAARKRAVAAPESALPQTEGGAAGRQAATEPADEAQRTDQAATGSSEASDEDGVAPATATPDPSRPATPEVRYGIAGSKWNFADSTGANFTAVLRPDGTVRGPVLSGDWTWQAEGSSISMEYRNGIGHWSKRQGVLQSGNAMQGTGQSSLGDTWTWNATRTK
jgi:peptidoglycan hydrolase-like protein with peptidoglycan-binding domain